MISQIKFKNITKLFADDSVFLRIDNFCYQRKIEVEKLQKDVDFVCDWCKTWVMRLDLEKWKVMHFVKFNPKVIYCISDILGNEL